MEQDRNIPQEIKDRLDIVDVISPYVKLKKAGKNYSGVCPFHNEKTGSFMVSPEIQRYKCFGCGKSGDIITFTMEIETLEFPEALKKLAKDAGIKYEPGRKNSKHTTLEKINEEATTFFINELKHSKPAQEYLTQRGLNSETISEFKIGFAPGYNKLLKSFSSQSYTKGLLIQSGLFSEKNNQLKDRFVNRIIFPIWSPQGKVVGFTARQMPGDDFGPKYLNSPETPIFQKRNILYTIYHSKGEIKKEDLAIFCEGPLDVISASTIDIKNIVAPFGTALTENQLALVRKYTDKLLFAFDNDEAGQKAMERAFILGSKANFTMYSINPEPYKDIDDLIQKEPSLVKKLLKQKVETYSYLLINQLSKENLESLEGRKNLTNYHKEIISGTTDKGTIDYYNEKFTDLTKIDLHQTTSKPTYRKAPPKQTNLQQKEVVVDKQEALFLALVIHNNLMPKIVKIDPKFFSDQNVREIIELITTNKYTAVEDLYNNNQLSEELKQTVEYTTFVYNKYPDFEDPNKTLNRLYLDIQKDYFRNMRDQLREKLIISEEKGNNDEARNISEEIIKINLDLAEVEKRSSKL